MSKLKRPADDEYFVESWSETFLQGDLFDEVPLAYPWPPDTTLLEEGKRRYLSGPFDVGSALLITPSCEMSAQQDPRLPPAYAHPVRTLLPIQPVEALSDAGAISDSNLGHLRGDRLRSYMYLPARDDAPESAVLLYMPITLHHDVIKDSRVAQMTGVAFRHLRVKLMAYSGGFLLDPAELGEPEADQQRTS